MKAVQTVLCSSPRVALALTALTANARPLRPRTLFVGSNTKMDAVSTALDRREMHEIYYNRPDTLVSGHVHIDASPVTGAEMQGLIIDL